MTNYYEEENTNQQQFVADYEDCTANHKNFADRPFVIDELPVTVIDKIMTGGTVADREGHNYKKDYLLQGILHFYKSKDVRVIHGLNTLQRKEMFVLGRAIQALYN